MVGTDNLQNKTLPTKCQERNDESCETTSRVVVIPVVVEPVPIHDNLVTVIVEIRDVEVAIVVLHKCIGCRLFHHLLNSLKVVPHSASQCLSTLYQVSSFFEVSTYTTLSKTVVVDILDIWILGSVAGNRNLPHIHLLPFCIISENDKPPD